MAGMEWVAGALGVAAVLALMNLAGFAAMARDKRRAEGGQWRWPERRLLRIAFWGGSLGVVLAQRRLLHKTRKQPFARQLKAIIRVQAVLVLALVVALASQAHLRLQAKQALGGLVIAVAGLSEAWKQAERSDPDPDPAPARTVKINRGL